MKVLTGSLAKTRWSQSSVGFAGASGESSSKYKRVNGVSVRNYIFAGVSYPSGLSGLSGKPSS